MESLSVMPGVVGELSVGPHRDYDQARLLCWAHSKISGYQLTLVEANMFRSTRWFRIHLRLVILGITEWSSLAFLYNLYQK